MSTTWKVLFLVVGLAIAAALVYLGWTISHTVTPALASLSAMEKVKTYVALGFSGIVAFAFLFCLFAMFYLRLKSPQADIGIWLNIGLTCLGYIVGILAGLFGIAPPAQPGTGGSGSLAR